MEVLFDARCGLAPAASAVEWVSMARKARQCEKRKENAREMLEVMRSNIALCSLMLFLIPGRMLKVSLVHYS